MKTCEQLVATLYDQSKPEEVVFEPCEAEWPCDQHTMIRCPICHDVIDIWNADVSRKDSKLHLSASCKECGTTFSVVTDDQS